VPDQHYTIEDVSGKKITVRVRKDKRLKKSSRWVLQPDGTVLIRVPYRLSQRNIGYLLDQVATQLKGIDELAERRTDAELQLRAEQINKKYFEGKIRWRAIRWVSNMNTRLGSCTGGGRTDGHIRISDKIKNWPPWVVDYVIAHELVHRLYPDHSEAFWQTLTQGYPLSERARGFIKGVSFVEGHGFEE
jgi:hypothetical protein